MTRESNLYERLATLEEKERQSEKRLNELEIVMAYYNKLALKWGAGCIAILTTGAVIGGHFDKLKEKIIEWFLS